MGAAAYILDGPVWLGCAVVVDIIVIYEFARRFRHYRETKSPLFYCYIFLLLGGAATTVTAIGRTFLRDIEMSFELAYAFLFTSYSLVVYSWILVILQVNFAKVHWKSFTKGIYITAQISVYVSALVSSFFPQALVFLCLGLAVLINVGYIIAYNILSKQFSESTRRQLQQISSISNWVVGFHTGFLVFFIAISFPYPATVSLWVTQHLPMMNHAHVLVVMVVLVYNLRKLTVTPSASRPDRTSSCTPTSTPTGTPTGTLGSASELFSLGSSINSISSLTSIELEEIQRSHGPVRIPDPSFPYLDSSTPSPTMLELTRKISSPKLGAPISVGAPIPNLSIPPTKLGASPIKSDPTPGFGSPPTSLGSPSPHSAAVTNFGSSHTHLGTSPANFGYSHTSLGTSPTDLRSSQSLTILNTSAQLENSDSSQIFTHSGSGLVFAHSTTSQVFESPGLSQVFGSSSGTSPLPTNSQLFSRTGISSLNLTSCGSSQIFANSPQPSPAASQLFLPSKPTQNFATTSLVLPSPRSRASLQLPPSPRAKPYVHPGGSSSQILSHSRAFANSSHSTFDSPLSTPRSSPINSPRNQQIPTLTQQSPTNSPKKEPSGIVLDPFVSYNNNAPSVLRESLVNKNSEGYLKAESHAERDPGSI